MYNLPNILTISRIVVIPVIFLSIYIHTTLWSLLAGILFVVASITDYLDGYLARARNQNSVLGRLLDPIADKLLVVSALLIVVANNLVDPLTYIPVIIIMCREVLVSGLREFLAEFNVGMPVTRLAKWKTGFQMVAIAMILLQDLPLIGVAVGGLGEWLLWVAGILTFITGYQYFEKCLDYVCTVENNKKNPVREVEKGVKNIAAKVKKTVENAVTKKTVARRGRKPKLSIGAEDVAQPQKAAAKAAVKGRKRRKKMENKLKQNPEAKVSENVKAESAASENSAE